MPDTSSVAATVTALDEDLALQDQTRRTQLLMCAPTRYSLQYEINPWMSLQNSPDVALAVVQWKELYRVITEDVGAEVLLVEQAEGCPDMVFTANAGLVSGSQVTLSNFHHPERQVEEEPFKAWFEANGYKVHRLSVGCKFEGEGDALFVGNVLVAGYMKRSDICAHEVLSDLLTTQVLSVELVDDRWYHLDTCFFSLTENTVVYYPEAFDPYAREVIAHHFKTIAIDEDEALRFACNAVVIGKHVVLPSGCPKLTQILEEQDYTVHPVELSEFLKAGGAAKCLVLFLQHPGYV